MTIIPEKFLELVQRPLIGHLATIRPDNTPQVNPVWFDWDGTHLLFTDATVRQKQRNIKHNKHVSLSIVHPDNPYSYVEIRGIVEEIIPDPEGKLYSDLNVRYSANSPEVPLKEHRLIVKVRPTKASGQ